ncbi:hypothetical protein [Kribbella sp. ALI-6-A]|nr:hypothetical protein [Kribbella sp. ALI-6-A]
MSSSLIDVARTAVLAGEALVDASAGWRSFPSSRLTSTEQFLARLP